MVVHGSDSTGLPVIFGHVFVNAHPFLEVQSGGTLRDVELRSDVGFLALHGGNQDRVTEEIACGAASAAGASLYAVVQPPNLRWHIPSTAVQPSASPRLAKFIDHVDVAIAVHGYGREGYWTTILLGGANRVLLQIGSGYGNFCLRVSEGREGLTLATRAP